MPPSGPARPAALLAVVLMAAPALAGCLVADIPLLFQDPTEQGGGGGTNTNGTAADEPVVLQNVTWEVGDTWVWEGANGVRLTDEVIAVRQVQRFVGGENRTVTRYDVQATEEFASNLAVTRTHHTYEPQTLGVINSSTAGVDIRYFRDGQVWRNVPLLYMGNATYETHFNVSRDGGTSIFSRSVELYNEGLTHVQVPAGAFEAWHVGTSIIDRRSYTNDARHHYAERWFNATVGNDVRFQVSGVQFELIAYTRGGEGELPNLPALPATGGEWGLGWAWRYAGENGMELERRVIACTDFFDTCRGRYVLFEDVEYVPLLTTVTTPGTGVVLREYALLSKATGAPVHVDHVSGSQSSFHPDLLYDPAGPALRPTAGTTTFTMSGVMRFGVPVDHDVTARVSVGSATELATVFGNVTVQAVTTNFTYEPNGQGKRFQQEHERLWSEDILNDVRFERDFLTSVVTFDIESAQFGFARKVEREW